MKERKQQLWRRVMRKMAWNTRFYVSRFLEFVDIGMKPAERRTSGLILGRVIYIRMETEPNAFAKHFFFLLNPGPYARYFRHPQAGRTVCLV